MALSATLLHLIDDTDGAQVAPIAEAVLSHTCPPYRLPPRAEGGLPFPFERRPHVRHVLRRHGVPVWYSETGIRRARQWHDEIGTTLKRRDWMVLFARSSRGNGNHPYAGRPPESKEPYMVELIRGWKSQDTPEATGRIRLR